MVEAGWFVRLGQHAGRAPHNKKSSFPLVLLKYRIMTSPSQTACLSNQRTTALALLQFSFICCICPSLLCTAPVARAPWSLRVG